MDGHGYLANGVADARLTHEERREWYRQLRLMKQRRRMIASLMYELAVETWRLSRRLQAYRDPYQGLGLAAQLEDAVSAASGASVRIQIAEAEAEWLSRERVLPVRSGH